MSEALSPWEWSELVACDPELERHVVAVAARVALSMGAHDRGVVPLERLVRLTRYVRSVVADALRQLKARGWLDVVQGRLRGRATVYQLTAPSLLRGDEVRPAGRHQPHEVRSSGRHGSDEGRSSGRHQGVEVRPSRPQEAVEVRSSGPLLGEERKRKEDPSYLPVLTSAPPLAPEDVAYVVDRLPTALRPRSPMERQRFEQLVAQRLDAGIGWTPEGLVEAARSCIETDVRSPVGLWARHVDREGPPAPTADVVDLRPIPGKRHAPWCGTCDERTRWVEDDDGRPLPCPDCHHSGLRVALDA